MRKIPALKAVFARLFRLSADKDYTLHVQWSAQRRSLSLPLSPTVIKTLTAVFAVLGLGFACLAWETGAFALQAFRYHYASARHQIGLSDLSGVQGDLRAIESSVEDAFRQEQRMRALYGINYLGASQSQFGVGGRAHPQPGDGDLSQDLYERLFHAELKGRQLRGKLDYTLRNFLQIREFVDYRHRLWEHTPSVVPAPGNWTSGFGYRVHPITGRYHSHSGLDISGNRWTPVHATAAGRVTYSAGHAGGYGNLVVIQHENGYTTKYGHLNRILVRQGQKVKRFDVIGFMGSTGSATGVHVHYEVLLGKEHIDPERFILPTGLIVD